MIVPIVFSTDHNFIMPTGVAILSLLEQSNDCNPHICVLQSDDVSDSDRDILKSICDQYSAPIDFISIGDTFKDSFEIRGITTATYYRLLIPWLMPEYEKVIYCDGDVIFLQSVSKIFSFNLGDCYIGGVRQGGSVKGTTGYKYCQSLGINGDGYVNAGVLLMNTVKMREMNLQEEFRMHAQKKYKYQDIINIVCSGHIAYMPSGFNTGPGAQADYIADLLPEIGIEKRADYSRFATEDNGRVDPVVIHFTNRKPWKEFTWFWTNWWNFYTRSPFFNSELQFRVEAATHSLTHVSLSAQSCVNASLPMADSSIPCATGDGFTDGIKVSVCVPVYNVSAYIERCARSLFDQTLDALQFIFVNDCSPDDSVCVLRRVAEEYPNLDITIIEHAENGGPGIARSTAASHAHGEYIYFPDADDWIEPTMLEMMYAKGKSENADLILCQASVDTENGSQEIRRKLDLSHDDWVDTMIRRTGPTGCTTVMMERKLYKKASERIELRRMIRFEDWLLRTNLHYYSRKCVYIDKTFYHINRFVHNSVTSTNSLAAYESILQAANQLEDFLRSTALLKKYATEPDRMRRMAYDLWIFSEEMFNPDRWRSLSREHRMLPERPTCWRFYYKFLIKAHCDRTAQAVMRFVSLIKGIN